MQPDPSGGAHPLLAVLVQAAAGRFPPADGAVEWLAPDAAGTHAVVELTGHSFVLCTLDAAPAATRGSTWRRR